MKKDFSRFQSRCLSASQGFGQWCVVALLSAFLSNCAHQSPKGELSENENASDLVQNNEAEKSEQWSLEKAVEHAKTLDSDRKRFYATSFFMKAQMAHQDGYLSSAIEAYQIALAYEPNEATIELNLAEVYLKSGKVQESISLLDKVVKKNPDSFEAKFLLAGLKTATGHKKEGLKFYRELHRKDPNHIQTLILYSSLLVDSGKEKEGRALIAKAVAREPEDAMLYYYMARIDIKTNHNRSAVKNLEKSLKLSPKFHQAGGLLAELYEEMGQKDKAAHVYEDLFYQGQTNYVSELIGYYMDKNNYSEVEKVLALAVDSDPENLNLRSRYGLILVKNQKYAEAEAEFKKVVVKLPQADRVKFYLGALYLEQKKYAEAAEILTKVQPKTELFPQAAIQVGQIYAEQGEMDKALDWIHDAIKKQNGEEGEILLHRYLAGLLSDAGKPKEALKHLISVRGRFSEDESFLYQLGVLYDTTGDWTLAEKTIGEILKVNPDHAHALNFLGYSYVVRGINLKRAEELLVRANHNAPEDGQILDSLGWLFFKQGKYEKALSRLEKAVGVLGLGNLEVTEHLAEVYLKLSRPEDALAVYEQALNQVQTDTEKLKLKSEIEKLKQAVASNKKKDREPASSGKFNKIEQKPRAKKGEPGAVMRALPYSKNHT